MFGSGVLDVDELEGVGSGFAVVVVGAVFGSVVPVLVKLPASCNLRVPPIVAGSVVPEVELGVVGSVVPVFKFELGV